MKDRQQGPNSDFPDPKYPQASALLNQFAKRQAFTDQITNLTPSLIAVYNIQTGRYVFINKSLKPLLGYEPEEWLEKGVQHVSSKVHPEDLPRIMSENQKALDNDLEFNKSKSNNQIVEFEYRVEHATGGYKWLKTYGTIFDRDSLGRPLHVINISLDITAIKNTEERLTSLMGNLEQGIEERTRKLKESEEKYHTIFSTLAEGVVLQDITGKILIANPSAQKILNLDFHQLKNRSLQKSTLSTFIDEHGGLLPDNKFPYLVALETGEAQNNAKIGIVRDKQTTWILVNSVPLKDLRGKIYAVASSFQDITEQKQLEKQKDEFISIASHELKTPLTTIKSYTEILQMQFSGEEKAQHYLTKMNGEIDRLTGLVNDLLDVSKIQTGGLILNRDNVRLDQLIEEVVEDIQPSSRHQIIAEKIVKTEVFVDKYRMYQVLINLISNAIKYSPKGEKVIINTKLMKDRLVISVKDFGIGISKRDKKKIFAPFFQAATTIRQSHSGLGLGLHICNEIITKHNGTISVYTKKGVGSTFRVSLPLTTGS